MPPRDPAALAEAIARLDDDAPFRATLGAAAQRAALEHFDPEHVARRIVAIYRDVLARRAGAGAAVRETGQGRGTSR